MTVAFLVLIALAIGVVVWLALRRAEAFLARREVAALFEVDEAVEFVASALPHEISARLTYEDVEALLGWQLLHLADREGEGEVDIADDQVVADLVARAAADGRDLTEADVRAVLAAEAEYLAAVGALEDDEGGAPGGDPTE